MNVLHHILDTRIVAILRGDYQGKWVDFAGGLIESGITALEITLNSAGALEGIAVLKQHFGDQIALGAGTVLSTVDVDAAVDAGAAFIVAPDTDEAVINACHARGVVAMPGAYTPTEIKRAYQLGAALVKLFPAQSPEYIKAVCAPLAHIPLMATGGIDVHNAPTFYRAGARVLGIGSSLVNPSFSTVEVAQRAVQFVAAAQGKQLV
jgi:2-dehydro-3-deoxyphosphogluconate aldolase / (4S)-4-hydroxy-2-oxoglutarate aldolase